MNWNRTEPDDQLRDVLEDEPSGTVTIAGDEYTLFGARRWAYVRRTSDGAWWRAELACVFDRAFVALALGLMLPVDA